jgi:ABC-type multidrug transport system fused ATPase/permease subunit
VPQLALPIVMLWRMHSREEKATLLKLKFFQAQNRMLAFADDVAKNYRLVRDFTLRPAMATKLEHILDDVNYFNNAVASHNMRSRLAVPLLSVFIAGAMMSFAPWLIVHLAMSPGVFLATLTATQQMGDAAEQLALCAASMQMSISALLKIFSHMNRKTDTTEAMYASIKQRERGKQGQAPAEGESNIERSDEMCIELLGVGLSPPAAENARKTRLGSFAVGGMPIEPENSSGAMWAALLRDLSERVQRFNVRPPLRHRCAEAVRSVFWPRARCVATEVPHNAPLRDINLQLKQGRVYAVVGGHESGKSQLLRMIAKAMHPTCGEVFVPPHLSVMHVEQSPQIFRHLSMYDNLVIGLSSAHQPPIEAILSICDALGLPPAWLDFLRVTAAPPEHGAKRLRSAVRSVIRLRRLRKSKIDEHDDAWMRRPLDSEAATHEDLWNDRHEEEEQVRSTVWRVGVWAS